MEIWYFQSGPGVPEQPECGVYPFDLCRYGSDCQTDGINWRKLNNPLSQCVLQLINLGCTCRNTNWDSSVASYTCTGQNCDNTLGCQL